MNQFQMSVYMMLHLHSTWSSRQIYHIEKVVTGYLHMHRKVVDEVYLIEANGSSLGLTEQPWSNARNELFSASNIIARGRELLRTSVKGNALLCRAGQEADFLRNRRIWCEFQPRSEPFQYTFVAFTRARQPGLRNPSLLHCDIRLVVTMATQEAYGQNVIVTSDV